MPGHKPASAFPSLLHLPLEIIVKILLELDVRTLVLCRRVCRFLQDLVTGENSIQYKIELAKACMIDGPDRHTSVPERLERLRAYRCARLENPVWVRAPDTGPLKHCSLFSAAAGLLTFHNCTTELEDLFFWRAPSSTRGVPSTIAALTGRRHYGGLLSVEVDLSQDLVVVTEGFDTLGQRPRCLLFSLSQNIFHPLAIQPILQGPPVREWTLTDCVSLHGDLLAWVIHDVTLEVYNWKTGMLLMVMPQDGLSPGTRIEAHLLDPTRVLLPDWQTWSLLVYDIDPQKPVQRADDGSPVQATPSCSLALNRPPGFHSHTCLIESTSRRSSLPLVRDCLPVFELDSSWTLLALYLAPRTDMTVAHILLVPYRTIEEICTQVQAISGGASSGSPTVVTWEAWGPVGARSIQLDIRHPFQRWQMDSLGPRCWIYLSSDSTFQDGTSASKNVFEFDVHPYARTHHEDLEGHLPRWSDSGGLVYALPMQTTYPCAVTTIRVQQQSDLLPDLLIPLQDGCALSFKGQPNAFTYIAC
ncbi:hypothetical protein K466DRAFT_174633 [Polyporus arcularius HHB13444]|uniref:F-box domain-containing protein n=1 Tax=Polyporus arcularius HHB13444 TaxID=1314778 RepID=A0A5C3P831_9APHY|nr:hypothetical protein K466DRAFT_174633 [Polyporus arcularius HHB13444]